MNICFGLTWIGGLKLPSPPFRLRRPCVFSHNKEMARKHTWQFISNFQCLHFPWNLDSELFFSNEGIPAHSRSHILFVLYGDAPQALQAGSPLSCAREQGKVKRTFSSRGFAARFRTCGYVASACARAPTWTCSRATSGVAILAKTSQAPWKRSKD